MKYIFVGILLLFLFFPSISILKNTYQSSLWTLTNKRRNDNNKDIQFRIGDEIDGIQKWTRLRLGLVIKPITIDIQRENHLIQVRIEIKYLLLNICFSILVISIVYGIKKTQMNKNF